MTVGLTGRDELPCSSAVEAPITLRTRIGDLVSVAFVDEIPVKRATVIQRRNVRVIDALDGCKKDFYV